MIYIDTICHCTSIDKVVVHAWICFVTLFTVDVDLIRVAHPSITIPITQAMSAIYMSTRVLNNGENERESKENN